MPDVIVIGGAPGSGKSTLAAGLKADLRGPWIDFGRLREFHLERDWSDEGPDEEAMTFANLVFILRNYIDNGYRNVLVDDLRDFRIQQAPAVLADLDLRIVTLVVSDDDELRRRILVRNDGWNDAERAVKWNHAVIERYRVEGEHRIDTAGRLPGEVAAAALEVIRAG